jgi:O-antigen/teichoic acid export membrane protein
MYADVNIIFFMLGQSATGQYAPATSIISALYILPQAVYSVMLPILSALIAKQDSHLWKAIRGTLWGMTMMGAALWLGVGLLGPPIISLFLGPGYPLSGPVLGILSAILFLKSGSFAMVTLLTAAGWQRQRVAVQALSALVNVGLNLTFIRQYGIVGVAWIYVASEVLLLAGNLAFALLWERRTARSAPSSSPG